MMGTGVLPSLALGMDHGCLEDTMVPCFSIPRAGNANVGGEPNQDARVPIPPDVVLIAGCGGMKKRVGKVGHWHRWERIVCYGDTPHLDVVLESQSF
jgi:hypothetical protein